MIVLDSKQKNHCQKMISHLRNEIKNSGGYLSFDSWMDQALYAPNLGYYSSQYLKNNSDLCCSDFVTSPEITPLFSQVLAVQVAQILKQCSSKNILELGAGSGILAKNLLQELEKMDIEVKYNIIEVSKEIQLFQKNRLLPLGKHINWLKKFPKEFEGCIIGNEFLDAIPVSLFRWSNHGTVLERGVGLDKNENFIWLDKQAPNFLSALVSERVPPISGYLSEINIQAEKWISTIAKSLNKGAVIIFDYGFPRHEYYHPQRNFGTLMCHFQHHTYSNPLLMPGIQDITSHIDFTSIAEAGIKSNLDIIGYTSQARFLINIGLLDRINNLEQYDKTHYFNMISSIQKLVLESEMGELFKVLVLGRGIENPLLGFSYGNRIKTL
ncbi:MAG: SAM-dependent methyltransferase [Bordetella sp.]|nr:MAG: SAM-dependent methyltransferase [Bordetella sp.]